MRVGQNTRVTIADCMCVWQRSIGVRVTEGASLGGEWPKKGPVYMNTMCGMCAGAGASDHVNHFLQELLRPYSQCELEGRGMHNLFSATD